MVRPFLFLPLLIFLLIASRLKFGRSVDAVVVLKNLLGHMVWQSINIYVLELICLEAKGGKMLYNLLLSSYMSSVWQI